MIDLIVGIVVIVVVVTHLYSRKKTSERYTEFEIEDYIENNYKSWRTR